MGVLIFAHNFPPATDGGAKLLSLIALEQKRRGERVLVLTSDAYLSDEYLNPRAKRIGGIGDFEGIEVIRIWSWRWGKSIIRRVTGPIFPWLPWRTVWRFGPKKIIAGVFPTTIPIYGCFLAKIFRSRLILVPCFHQGEKSFYRFPLLWVLKRADEIWALSGDEKRFYQKSLGIPGGKIALFRPKMEKKIFLPGERKAKFDYPPTIIFLGSQAAHKRIDWLIEAFKRLKKRDSSLIIVGPHTLYSPKIREKLSRLPKRVRKNIRILGKVSEKKKIALLDQAWVLVNPSIHESLGLVFFEAWARKKPVIASDLPVLREVIDDGRDGFLFEKDSISDLIEKMSLLIENPRLARKMGEAGYNKMVQWQK